jgi:hypothetical protein
MCIVVSCGVALSVRSSTDGGAGILLPSFNRGFFSSKTHTQKLVSQSVGSSEGIHHKKHSKPYHMNTQHIEAPDMIKQDRAAAGRRE